jgi:RNA polymerase-binding transcription factor DksA
MKRRTRSSMKRMNSKVRCGSVSHGSLAKLPHELTKTPRLRKQLQRLLKLREDLAREVYQLRAEACEEIPNYGLHMADAATDSFDRDLVLGLASFEQEGLYEIDAALKRMEDGTYGICELTGKPIAWERLKAIPWTRFSLEAENQLERHRYPHIGRLGAVRPPEKKPYDPSNDFADQEREFTADSDPFQTYFRVKPQARAENDGGLPGGE